VSDDLAEQVADLERRLESLSDVAIDNDGEIERLGRELDGLRAQHSDRLDTIEHELKQLNQSVGFINQAAAAEASSVEAQAALALQTLVNKARSNGGAASLDWEGVQDALNGEIHRTKTYDVMRTLDTACDAAEHIEEDRNADRNTRIELRMDHGETYYTELGGQTVAVTMEEV